MNLLIKFQFKENEIKKEYNVQNLTNDVFVRF